MLEQKDCQRCGGDLMQIGDNQWKCRYCGKVYEAETVADYEEFVKKYIEEGKRESVKNARRALYSAINADYISNQSVHEACEMIKTYIADDFQANFYEAAIGDNGRSIARRIRKIDIEKHKIYIEDIVVFLIRSLQAEYILETADLIEKAYKQTDLLKFEKYSTELSAEAEKIDNCIYMTTFPRDVFVAYSSKDMTMVNELVECLEDQGLSCFVAARNLRHGKGAVENYDKALKEAMDNCQTFVFVSSTRSRHPGCDALRKEIPYIKICDMQAAPPQYKNDYTKIPHMYKKPRVEYRIEESRRSVAADRITDEFFDGYERVYSVDEVADRVLNQSIEFTPPEIETTEVSRIKYCVSCQSQCKEDDKFCSMCGKSRFANTVTELELMLKIEELSKAPRSFGSSSEQSEKSFDNGRNMNLYQEQPKEELPETTKIQIEDRAIEQKLEAVFEQAEEVQIEPETEQEPETVSKQAEEIQPEIKVDPEPETVPKQAEEVQIEPETEQEPETVPKQAEEIQPEIKVDPEPETVPEHIEAVQREIKVDPESETVPEHIEAVQREIKVEKKNEAAFEKISKLWSNDSEVYTDSKRYSVSQTRDTDNRLQIDPKHINSRIARERTRFLNEEEKISITNQQFDSFCHRHNVENGVLIKYKDNVFYAAIPEGITEIFQSAFLSCRNLHKVKLPRSLKKIDKEVFWNCKYLQDIELPEGLELIGAEAFWNCNLLENIYIPKSVKQIGNNAFKYCNSLKSIEIPEGIVRIKEGTFQGCSSLAMAVLPDSLQEIGEMAFEGCRSLQGIELPEGVTRIEDHAFAKCGSIKSLVIPSSVNYIGKGVFEDCVELKKIVVTKGAQYDSKAIPKNIKIVYQ